MYKAKKTSPINNMKFIQYKFDVGFKNNVKREPKSEIEDSSIQLELMDSFYEVKRDKPTDISFEFLILIHFVNIVIRIKLQNMVIMSVI